MIILRQKNYARSMIGTKGTFRNRLKSFYHNTGSSLNRRLSRTVAMGIGHPDIAAVKAAANTVQPFLGVKMMKEHPILGATVAGAPISYAYIPFSKKIAQKIPIGKGRTLADWQTKVTKNVYIKNKKLLDKVGINENMKSLDSTLIGKGMAKTYKAGESILKYIKSGSSKPTIDPVLAPTGNLALRPVHA